MQTREWTDKEGQKRFSTEVIASDMNMLDSKRSQEGEGSGNYQTAGATSKPKTVGSDNPFSDDGLEQEDLPF